MAKAGPAGGNQGAVSILMTEMVVLLPLPWPEPWG